MHFVTGQISMSWVNHKGPGHSLFSYCDVTACMKIAGRGAYKVTLVSVDFIPSTASLESMGRQTSGAKGRITPLSWISPVSTMRVAIAQGYLQRVRIKFQLASYVLLTGRWECWIWIIYWCLDKHKMQFLITTFLPEESRSLNYNVWESSSRDWLTFVCAFI